MLNTFDKRKGKITPKELKIALEGNRLRRLKRKVDPNHEMFGDDIFILGEKYVFTRSEKFDLVRSRAKWRDVYGYCDVCDGNGFVYTEESEPILELFLWVIHPRKGASRGIRVNDVSREDFHDALDFLKLAAKRNADRFSGVVGYC